MKKDIKHRFLRSSRLPFGTALLLLLALQTLLLLSGSLHPGGENHHSPLAVNLYQPDTPGEEAFGEWAWLRQPAFRRLIERHNQYLPELANWRRQFAGHAAGLAQLISTFPGGESLDEGHLQQVFSRPESGYDSLVSNDLFAPWTNRWSGFWSNGALQYHLWDSACCVNRQWIQPVTLSEERFVDEHCVEEMLLKGETDIAINVFSRENGITGWVSKYQHGRYEIPHVGYRVNDSTLVWICQIKKAGELFLHGSQWLVFLETVDRSKNPPEYRIYGQPVIIEETFSVVPGQENRHRGIYREVKDIPQI